MLFRNKVINIFYSDELLTLYVPKGRVDLYAQADQWKNLKNIEEFFNGVSLVDGEAYAETEDQEDVDVTYKRKFAADIVDDVDGNGTIYDLMGREVKNPPNGIYIQNGKKTHIY